MKGRAWIITARLERRRLPRFLRGRVIVGPPFSNAERMMSPLLLVFSGPITTLRRAALYANRIRRRSSPVWDFGTCPGKLMPRLFRRLVRAVLRTKAPKLVKTFRAARSTRDSTTFLLKEVLRLFSLNFIPNI